MWQRSVPDRKWVQLVHACKAQAEPNDPRLARMYRVMMGTEQDETIENALAMIETDFYKNAVMAFLFSRATLSEIIKSLQISAEVIGVIEYLLFNSDEIHNKLDHIYWAKKYMAQLDNDEDRNLIHSALVGGPCAIMDRFALGDEDPVLDTGRAAKRMLVTAMNLGLVCRGNSITTEASKQALKWFDSASKMLMTYDKMVNDDDADTDAIVAIERRKQTYTLSEIGVESITDILH
jgi:hypothetical protein